MLFRSPRYRVGGLGGAFEHVRREKVGKRDQERRGKVAPTQTVTRIMVSVAMIVAMIAW